MISTPKIDGDMIAEGITSSLGREPVPFGSLVVISCAASPASVAFIGKKRAVADILGIPFAVRVVPVDVGHEGAVRAVLDVSADACVRAIVLQLPLPACINRGDLIAHIDPLKDIDNLTGRAPVESPSVLVVREILARSGYSISDFKNIVVVGAGFLVGAPIVRWLAATLAPYAVIDIDTPDPISIIRAADLVISGVGKTGVIDPSSLPDGTGFIDFGFPPDADQSLLAAHAGRLRFFTPTPHGTGPILVAKLFENFYRLG